MLHTADAHSFRLFAERDPDKVNVLDLSQWKLSALPAATINRELGSQKSLSLSRHEGLAKSLDFDGLKHTIDGWVQKSGIDDSRRER